MRGEDFEGSLNVYHSTEDFIEELEIPEDSLEE
jgi:hypothetical protein